MAFRVFNTLNKQVEEFKPIKEGEVSLYTCGPTVYNYAHIGNCRANLSYDIFKRYLLYKGFKVNHVMNITDVDDKTIRDSQKEGVPFKEFVARYTQAFYDDLSTLNILHPDTFTKATEYIPDMVDFIKILLEKGIAYKSDDGSTYFSVSKFPEYGKLSGVDLSQLQAGASGRVASDEYEKDQVADFALWKAYSEDDGDVFWETELGKGRPGWHIECSAMSTKELGHTFDVHMGGVDLKFPHHENEIAQSEACTGKKFVNYWLHNEHLQVDGKKMSKSLGNFYTLRDLLDKNFSPMAIRYALLAVQYNQKMNFTLDGINAAQAAIDKMQNFIDSLNHKSGSSDDNIPKLIEKLKTDFEAAMDDDLETSKALAAVFEFMHEVNKLEISPDGAAEVRAALEEINLVLGVMDFEQEPIPDEIKALAEERLKAREQKNWESSDKLRDEIASKGYEISDTPDGYSLKKV